MKTKIFGFFITVLLSLFLFFSTPKKTLAIYCQSGGAYDSIDGVYGKGVIGHNIRINYWYFKDSSELILSRYIYDGRNWIPTSPTSNPFSTGEYMQINTTYSEAKDYGIAGGFVYKDASGQTKTFICTNYLRVFESETKNFGSITVSYPESKTLIITGKKSYVGWFINNGGKWNGFFPYKVPNCPGGSYKTWDWTLKEDYWGLSSTQCGPGYWEIPSSQHPFIMDDVSVLDYPKVLPQQLTLDFTPPTFSPADDGNGSYAIYDFTNVIVYSRDNAGGILDQPPCLPGFCVTPIPTPLPTLTPFPVPSRIKVYGRVKDIYGNPLSGAKILVHKTDSRYGSCSGQHWSCSPEYVTTDANGYWTSFCQTDSSIKSILIKETNNSSGYTDSSRNPDPVDGSIWNVNTVCHNNLTNKTAIGAVVFYDKK